MEHEGYVAAEGGRRRRWSIEDKRAIVELSLDPDSSTAEIAATFGLQPNQIYAWRRELREMVEDVGDRPMFLPAAVEPEPVGHCVFEADHCDGELLPHTMVQVALTIHGVPVMIAHGADAMVVRAVIDGLKTAQ